MSGATRFPDRRPPLAMVSPLAIDAPPARPAEPGMAGIRWAPLPGVDDGGQLRPLERPRRARRWRHQVGAWAHRHRRSLLVVAGLLLVVGAVHGVGMDANPAPVDDEGTYVSQAWALVVRHTLTPYTYWYDHPPFGWMVLALWGWITDGFRPGQHALVVGRQLVLVAQMVSTALLYLVARRLGMNRIWSAAVVLFWALSPLDVIYGRMVYLDNLAVPWMLGAFALALSPRRNLWAMAGSGVAFALAVLSKETLLIFLPGLVWQVYQQTDRRTRAFCMTAFFAALLLVGGTYPLYAILKGELLPGPGHVSLLSAVEFQLAGRAGSGSIFASHSQAHLWVTRWLGIDPWLVGAGAVLTPAALAIRRLRPFGIAYLTGLLVLLRTGYLPAPYPIAMLPLAAVVAVGVLASAWQVARGWGSGRARRVAVLSAKVASLAAATGVLVGAAPAWASADRSAMTADRWGPYLQAEAWIEHNVPHGARLLVGNAMWVDLVEHGFGGPLRVVWFYKLGFTNNLDPSVARALPGGWKEFAYVVETPGMRSAMAPYPNGSGQVIQAVHHSVVVARFGHGSSTIDIRRIVEPRPSPTGRRRAAPATASPSPASPSPATSPSAGVAVGTGSSSEQGAVHVQPAQP